MKTQLVIRIDLDNAAFEAGSRPAELRRIFNWYTDRLENGLDPITKLRDANGNTVGEARMKFGG